ncbi:class I adenylate-forming enzyme family protein [Amycolatopsis jejuensis]|uniref:class I adenylate-forming enzyme family protein n=1 Tax=Amycolatopsis jejuensis TaxID=330084 RepID=UPI000527E0D7|nr:class I adenylate-forming enzyme family protein [Amycolatopsis jejuensis]
MTQSGETTRRAEIVRELTGPGGEFALRTIEVRGIELPVYDAAPGSLREVFALGDRWGDRPAITYEDEQYTWAELTRAVAACAAALHHGFGVGKGDRVAIAMRNYPEWIIAFTAAASIGAICVPLNSWWSGEELGHVLADCAAKVLIADRERTESILPRRADLPALQYVVEVRPGTATRGDVAWTALLDHDCPEFDPASVPLDPDDDVTILYTSGTTGSPKGAVASHRAHLTNLVNVRVHGVVEARMAEWRGEQPVKPPARPVTLIPGPLFHVSYLPKVIGAAVTGAQLVLMYKWNAARAVELIERERVDGLIAVPTVMRQLLDEIERRATVPPSLRTLSTGGAQSTAALIDRIRTEVPTAVGTGYGMTETCGPMVMIGSRDYFGRPLSVGRPLPASQVRVVTADGREAATNEVGEAWFRGASLARGYWNRSGDAFTDDGWLKTGDLVKRDSEGFLSIVDRIKDIVIRGGENVYCTEVEEALSGHPAIEESAVFGIPHELWGEEVAAVVRVRPGRAVTAAELREYAGNRLARFKVPTTIALQTGPLPRNAAGKVLKRELRRIHPKETGTPT